MFQCMFNDYQFKADDIIEIISQLNSLKEFQFWIEHSECTRLEAQLENSEWQILDKFPCLLINLAGYILTLGRSMQ